MSVGPNSGGATRPAVRFAALGFAYLAAAAFGYAGSAVHLPLAWMLGPLFVAGVLAMLGAELDPPDNLRRLGQAVVGVGLGLQMTGPVLSELAAWFPAMVGLALLSVAVSVVGAAALARFAHLDDTTAFYAGLPGGLAEMGLIAAQKGGRSDIIAVAHTVRVILVVCTIPPLILFFNAAGSAAQTAVSPLKDVWWIPILVLGGTAVALLLRRAHLNNPFLVGAVLFTAVFAGSGMVEGRLPAPVFSAAQVLIGFAVGSRCKRDLIRRLPRLIAISSGVVMAMVVVMAGVGLLLSALSGLDIASGVLATAPGGLAEMAITAQVLHLSAPLVVGFQLTRGVLVNSLATHLHRLAVGSGYMALLRRLI